MQLNMRLSIATTPHRSIPIVVERFTCTMVWGMNGAPEKNACVPVPFPGVQGTCTYTSSTGTLKSAGKGCVLKSRSRSFASTVLLSDRITTQQYLFSLCQRVTDGLTGWAM